MMTGVLPTALGGKMEKTPCDLKISSSARVKRAFSPTSPSLTTRFRPGKGVPLAVEIEINQSETAKGKQQKSKAQLLCSGLSMHISVPTLEKPWR